MYWTEIISNGAKTYGESPDSIDELLAVLARHPLNRSFERAFVKDLGNGAKRFHGNCLTVAHVFDIRSNDPEIINRLVAAIRANRRMPTSRSQPSAARQMRAIRTHYTRRRGSASKPTRLG